MNKHTAALLAQHFDTAFAAPNGIKKLRELILTLAMQGKLVPQDPSDPPASELLKEIEAEKKRLVKEGKIKAPKPQPDISAEELPMVLPDGWIWVRNGFLFDLKKGKVPKDLSESVGSIPYLDIEALDRGNVRRYTSDTKAPQSTDRDILVVCDGSRSGLVLEGKNGAIGSTLSVIETPLFIQPFVKLIFRQGYQRMNSSMKGAAIPHLDSKNLLLEVVGLPPLAEQKRILEKVEELMARCDELEKLRTAQDEQRMAVHAAAMTQLLNVAQTEAHQHAQTFLADHFGELYTVKENVAELRKAILQLAVMGKLVPQDPSDPPASELLKEIEAEKKRLVKEGKIKAPKPLPPVSEEEKPYALPKGWEWVRMGNICLGVTSGTTPPKDLFSEKSGIPFLKVYNIRNQKIDFEYKKQFVDANHHRTKMARSKLVPGDVVMNIVGPPLGKVAVIPDDYPEYNCNQAIVVFRPIERKTNGYLYVYLLAGKFLDAIELVGTAGQDNISVTKSQMMPIPLPPLAEQQRIVARIDQLMALCDSLDRQIDAATTQQTALLDAMMAQV